MRIVKSIAKLSQSLWNWLIKFERQNSDILPGFKLNILSGISSVVGINVALTVGAVFVKKVPIPPKWIFKGTVALGVFAILLLFLYIIEEVLTNIELPPLRLN